MAKKTLSFILAVALILSFFIGLNLNLPSASAIQIFESDDYEYSVNHKNQIIIQSYLGNSRQVVIPSEIDGKPVVEIGAYSFNGVKRLLDDGLRFENHPNAWYNKRIKKITVPSTVKIIRENAFGCMNNLEEIVFNEGLRTVEEFAFADCQKLVKAGLPNSLDDFTLLAFDGTAVEEIVLGANVKSPYLEDLNGSKVKKIICNADEISFANVHFEGDTALEEIIINGDFHGGAFNGKNPIKRIVCNGEVTYNAVLETKSAGFEFCSDHKGNNVVFSKNDTDNRQTYEAEGFRYYLNEKNEAVISRYIGGKSKVTVPESLDGHKVTAIAPLAFSSLKTFGTSYPSGDDWYIDIGLLVSVTLPDTVKSIGKFAFAYNVSLEKINIPAGVEIIPAECFYGCKSIKNMVFPESVKEIGSRVFRLCEKLESIEMSGVVKVGDNAFDECRLLENVVFSEKFKEVGNSAFNFCKLADTLDLSSLTKIGAGAFSHTKVKKVILNDNLERLEYGVFQGCTLLEEINFPSKLVSIGECCFRMTEIDKAVFKEGLKEIGALAFDTCEELYILELPESIEKIGNYAFENTLLEIVVIPENLKVIGYRAFGYCEELDILYFNAKNCVVDFEQEFMDETDAPGNAPPFLGCNLREIYLGEGVTSIGGYSAPFGTFENCAQLESVMIPDSVTQIGTSAFKNCSALETAIIPGSVTSIADDAFDGCNNLTILCFANSYVHSYAKANGIKVSTFIVAPIPNQTYTGYEIKPDVTVSFSGDTLHKNIDFSVNYANNINVGQADVIVKGKGDYKNFSNQVKFTIITKNISCVTVGKIMDQPYTGSSVIPELIVTDGAKFLYENKDYTVTCSNNKKAGTATVKITGIGNYSGTLTTEFEIVKMDNGEDFFSNLIYRIEVFFAKIISFFSSLFSF